MKRSFLLLLMGAFLFITTSCSNSTPEVEEEIIVSDSELIEAPLVDTISFIDQQ
jgi:hypothetical protein